jgi:hypothetical protein
LLCSLKLTSGCIRETVGIGSLAALDADTEHRLFERWTAAAHRLRRATDAVTVLVSHRFSTVRMADLIVVLEHRQAVEVDSHAELMARRSLYAELFALQAQSYRWGSRLFWRRTAAPSPPSTRRFPTA